MNEFDPDRYQPLRRLAHSEGVSESTLRNYANKVPNLAFKVRGRIVVDTQAWRQLSQPTPLAPSPATSPAPSGETA